MLIHRYFFRNLLSFFLLTTLSLTLVIWLIQMLRYTEELADKGLGLFTILGFAVRLIPYLSISIIPFSFLFSLILLILHFSRHHEILVLQSFGMSYRQIIKPIIILACLVMALLYYVEFNLSPHNYRSFKIKQHFLKKNIANFALQPGKFNSPINGLTIYVDGYKDNFYYGLVVDDRRTTGEETVVMASKGRLLRDIVSNKTTFELYNGTRITKDKHQHDNLLKFDYYPLELSFIATAFSGNNDSPKEMGLSELLKLYHYPYSAKFAAELHYRLYWPLIIPTLSLITCLILFNYHRRFHHLGRYIFRLTLIFIGFTGTLIIFYVLSQQNIKLAFINYLLIATVVLFTSFKLDTKQQSKSMV